jgi:dipeptidyl aminopeptidase/acylaminoacyl peptidase
LTRLRSASGFALALVAVGLAPSAAAARRKITETDLFRFAWVADPRLSPDGKEVAFVRVTVNGKKDGYDTAIWTVTTEGGEPARPFTSGPRDSAPRWSPDGRSLAFLRAGLKDGKPEPPQIHLISARGGEARAVGEVPRGAGSLVWSPDGRSLAFVCSANAKDLEKKKARKTEAAADGTDGDEAERESDVRVISRSVYRFDGSGYRDAARPGHVWMLDVPSPGQTAEPRPLTRGEFDEGNLAWSPDGARVFFTTSRLKDAAYAPPDADLYSVPREGGEPRREASIDGPISDYVLSPDGRRVAFVGYENPKLPRSYDQSDLFVAELAGAGAKNLTSGFDNDVDGNITGDQRAPRGGLPTPLLWSQRFIVVKAAERGRGNLKRIDAASGTVEDLTTGDQDVLAYSARADGSALAAVVSTPTVIGDLVLVDAASGRTQPLYRPNEGLFAELDLTPPEEVVYSSFDGRKIQAWFQKPPDYVAGRRYPLLLNIHGGPHAAYGHVFMHEFQWMAAKGYVVLYPNPRGSSSYGQEFGNVIQYRYPGDDYKDLMAGVDELVKRGLADPERLGVTGGSGGGVLTNWTITQTDRFKAAVSQRSISDWANWWYTADFTQFQPEWFRGAPFEVPREFAERSAITHVAKVKTPLMLVEGEADQRTPSSAGGEPMFRALKYRKVPTVMVRFPGETHDLSRTGGPWHRVERLRHILGWFDRYVLGKPSIEYDVP